MVNDLLSHRERQESQFDTNPSPFGNFIINHFSTPPHYEVAELEVIRQLSDSPNRGLDTNLNCFELYFATPFYRHPLMVLEYTPHSVRSWMVKCTFA